MARKRERMRCHTIVGDPNDAEGLYAYLQRYLEYLNVKGHTEQGVYSADRYICQFIAWCDTRGLKRPNEITKPILERFQRHLFYYRKDNGEPLSIHSQRGPLVALRGYFKWLTKNNYILYNPASDLELPRMHHRVPKHILTVSEVEHVMQLPNVRDPFGLRDRALLEVLYSTGIRRMEIVNLKHHEIDFERGLLFVNQGKWQKDRWVPIGDSALHWVKQYLDDVRPVLVMPPDDGTLFITRYGEPFNIHWLSTTVAKYIKRANLNKHGGCHLFRHTMATLMLEGGADIRFIQAMLGHADLKSTQIYTQVAVKQLKAIHEATHPACVEREERKREGLPSVENENAVSALLEALASDDDDNEALTTNVDQQEEH